MRAHVAILLGVIIGILALVYLAGRKSSRSTTAAAAVTNTAPANVALRWKTRIPPATLAPEFEEPMEPPPSNFLQRANADDFDFHLTAEQKAEYLRQFGTNVETLLATQDTNYIRLAAQMFPHDPRVQFAVVARDLFPEQRREWLDRFKQSAPDNALADYFSARDYLKAGNRENAFKDLANAATKSRFDDYLREQRPNMEDAHLSAGRTLLDAKVAAHFTSDLPQKPLFRTLGADLKAVQEEYIRAGDAASAESIAQFGHVAGQQLIQGEGSQWMVGQQIGINIERVLLRNLPPDSQPAYLNGTVQQRLDELIAHRQSQSPLFFAYIDMTRRGNEAEIISYFNRVTVQGEHKAMLWLHNRDKLR